PVFLDRVQIVFDGVRDRPRFEYLPVSAFSDAAQAPSTVRLTGRVPSGAREMSFANGLAMGSHALNLRVGDAPVETVWLEGTQASPPLRLWAPRARLTALDVARQYFGLGFTHILPKGLDHILFVVGIFLLSTRWRSILLQVSTFTIAHSIT